MTKVDQRHFVSPGVRCALDKRRLAEGGDLSNVKLHVDFCLETADVLESKLTFAMATGTRMADPVREECAGVCSGFLLWAVGKSKSWFNQRDKNLPSRQYELEPVVYSLRTPHDGKTTSDLQSRHGM